MTSFHHFSNLSQVLQLQHIRRSVAFARLSSFYTVHNTTSNLPSCIAKNRSCRVGGLDSHTTEYKPQSKPCCSLPNNVVTPVTMRRNPNLLHPDLQNSNWYGSSLPSCLSSLQYQPACLAAAQDHCNFETTVVRMSSDQDVYCGIDSGPLVSRGSSPAANSFQGSTETQVVLGSRL